MDAPLAAAAAVAAAADGVHGEVGPLLRRPRQIDAVATVAAAEGGGRRGRRGPAGWLRGEALRWHRHLLRLYIVYSHASRVDFRLQGAFKGNGRSRI